VLPLTFLPVLAPLFLPFIDRLPNYAKLIIKEKIFLSSRIKKCKKVIR